MEALAQTNKRLYTAKTMHVIQSVSALQKSGTQFNKSKSYRVDRTEKDFWFQGTKLENLSDALTANNLN